MAVQPGDRVSHYDILASIGKGGMGEVYRARDTRLERDVAIKMSNAQFTERFEREAKIIATLNHPNICTLHDVGPNFLVMELIEGATLADRIKEGPIPFEEAMRLARQIAAALEEAHARNIVHRDLKPANIKIKPDGLVKVLDFGLAKGGPTMTTGSNDSPTITVGLTQAGEIMGTPAYMSPEQAKGKDVDKRTDIWSFGAVLYEMLTGKRLFDAPDFSEAFAAVIRADIDVSQAPKEAQRLLSQCLERDPAKRLRDIGDMDLLLRPPEVAASRSTWRHSIVPWAAAALLLATSATLAFLHFREPAPAPRESVAFTIPPPPNERFADAAASPDGRWLALTVLANGKTRLVLRSLDSLEQRQLSERDVRGSRAVWSRDSRYLFFSDSGKLKRVDVQGGPPQVLSDLQGGLRGGFTTADGRIVFSSNAAGLFQVPAAGGVAERIPNSEKISVGTNSTISLFPDGVHFLYSQALENGGIYVGTLNGGAVGESKRILRDESLAYYVPGPDSGSGYVLFIRDGSLLAQPFDERKLELAGDPTVIAQSANVFDASPGGVIAYGTGRDRLLNLTWYDRKGNTLGAVGQRARYASMALSPDGAQVAVQRIDADSTDLWLLAAAQESSGAATRFTFDKPNDMCPIWSPDGRQIAFASARNGPQEMYRKQSTGAGGDELLVKSKSLICPMDFSPDGRLLLYEDAPGAGTQGHLLVLPLEGDRKPFEFHKTEFWETTAKFSPDGKWIVYQSTESGRTEVYVRPFEGKEASGAKWLISANGGGQPRWTRDGKQIIYAALDSKLMAVDVVTSPTFKAGAPQLLFTPSYNFVFGRFHYWDMTRDGQRFLVETTGEDNSAAPVTVLVNWLSHLSTKR